MAGSPINPAMQQYLNGLNATVYGATAGLPTAGVGAGAAAAPPVSPYGAPAGFQAPPVAPSNTQFSGSQDMMNPGQQAAAQGTASGAEQNPQGQGGAAQNFIQNNGTTIGVVAALAAAGGGAYWYMNKDKDKAGDSSKPSPTSSHTSSSGSEGKKPSAISSSASSHRSSASSEHSTASSRSSTHSRASHASGGSGKGRLFGDALGMFTSKISRKKPPSPPQSHLEIKPHG